MLRSKKATRRRVPVKISWSTSGDFIYPPHDEPRTILYDPDQETFPIPWKYVDVVRLSKTDMDNVSDNPIDDLCTEAKDVNHSVVWTGTTKFQI